MWQALLYKQNAAVLALGPRAHAAATIPRAPMLCQLSRGVRCADHCGGKSHGGGGAGCGAKRAAADPGAGHGPDDAVHRCAPLLVQNHAVAWSFILMHLFLFHFIFQVLVLQLVYRCAARPAPGACSNPGIAAPGRLAHTQCTPAAVIPLLPANGRAKTPHPGMGQGPAAQHDNPCL